MRLVDHYAYANPFLEPVSLDALVVPDTDDVSVLTHPIPDPAVDLEHQYELTWVQATISAFLGTLGPRDRELVRRVYWEDESQAAVARSFRVSAAAISKRMARIEAKGRIALAVLRNSALLQ